MAARAGDAAFTDVFGSLHLKPDFKSILAPGPKLCWCIPQWLRLIFLMETSSKWNRFSLLRYSLCDQAGLLPPDKYSYPIACPPIHLWSSLPCSAAGGTRKTRWQHGRVGSKPCNARKFWDGRKRAGGCQEYRAPFPPTCSVLKRGWQYLESWQRQINLLSHTKSLLPTVLQMPPQTWAGSWSSPFEELESCSGIGPSPAGLRKQ